MGKNPFNAYRDKVILVTGGAGAIGSNLTRALARFKPKLVIVLDDLSASPEWNIPSEPNIFFIKGSILNEIILKRVFQEGVDYLFHLAAFFANQNSIDHPETDLMVNGLGFLRVLQYAHLARVKKVIYASSGCSIYGSKSPLPHQESWFSLHLSSPYQITKMLGELYCNFFFQHYGVPVVKTRLFNAYGPGELPGQYRNVIPNFIFWAMQGQPLPITGSGKETRDFTFVEDIVRGMLLAGAVEKAVGEEINLASGTETRIIDVARMINRFTENQGGIYHLGRRRWDTKDRLLASIEKARKILGYSPRVSLPEGIQQTIGWFKHNWDRIKARADFKPGMSAGLKID